MSIRKLEQDLSSITIALDAGPILASSDDIVLRIMDFLPHMECEKMALVCKRWHWVAESSPVYQQLFLKLGITNPDNISHKALFLEKLQEGDLSALFAFGFHLCNYLMAQSEVQKVVALIQTLERFVELSKLQQLELMLLKGDLYHFDFSENLEKDLLLSLHGELIDFSLITREEAQKTYQDARKACAEALYYFFLQDQEFTFSEGEIQSQNLLIDKRHRTALRFLLAGHSNNLATRIHLFKSVARDPASTSYHRIEAILFLGECHVFGHTDAVTDQEVSQLLASLYNNKAVPLSWRLKAKTLARILDYHRRTEVEKSVVTQWFAEIENEAVEHASLARLYKLMIQFENKSLDIDTKKQLNELCGSLNTLVSLIAGLYLAIMHYEDRIVLEGPLKPYEIEDQELGWDEAAALPFDKNAYTLLSRVEYFSHFTTGYPPLLLPKNGVLKAKLYMVLMHEKYCIHFLSPSMQHAFLKEVSESNLADPADVTKAKLLLGVRQEPPQTPLRPLKNEAKPNADYTFLLKLLSQVHVQSVDEETVERLVTLSENAIPPLNLIAFLALVILNQEDRRDFQPGEAYSELQTLIEFSQNPKNRFKIPESISLKAKLYTVLLYEKYQIETREFSFAQRYAWLKEVSESHLADPKEVLIAKLYMVIMHEKEPILILSPEEQCAFLNEVLASNLLDETYQTEALRLKTELENQL